MIGYSTGSPLRLIEDLQVLKPNVILSVPRVLNRIYQAIAANLKASGLKGALLRRGVAVKLEKFKQTGDHTHPFWDKLVFNKVKAIIGGKVELLGCGSAPLNSEIMDFLRVTLVCDIIQGYGMTENCGTCTRVFPGDPTAAGTVGLPQPVNEIKLVDVPSMGYSVLDKPHPRGEICVRGDNCFSEYYKSELPLTLFAPSVESLDLWCTCFTTNRSRSHKRNDRRRRLGPHRRCRPRRRSREVQNHRPRQEHHEALSRRIRRAGKD